MSITTGMKTIGFLFATAVWALAGCAASTGAGADGDDMNMQSGEVTLDSAGFIDDGTRWWTNHSGPQLTGTFDGSPSAVIDVAVGDHHVTAQASGATWTAQLPDGAITTADTLVTITATEPGGATQTRQQAFAVDNAAPLVTALPSPFHDERTDGIDFASGEPVHDHQGAVVELASDGCALVYKYAYLMDHAPIYGREVEANPIRWNLDVSDAKVASVDYRLRHKDGAVVRDWMPADSNGSSYSVVLHRDGVDGIGALANHYGLYVVEIRARDWSGLESLGSYCIEYEPLAAPLAIEKVAVASGPDALSSWTLAANSPISRLTNAGRGPVVFEQSFTQYANEPVVLTVGSMRLSGTASATLLQGYFAARSTRETSLCPPAGCQLVEAPSPMQFGGALTSFDQTIDIVDGSGTVHGPDANGMISIPARTTGGEPETYRIQLRLSNVTAYNNDPTAFVYGERSYLGLAWTGTDRWQTTTACAQVSVVNGLPTCTARVDYAYARAFDAISLALDPVSFAVRVAASTEAMPARPTYAAQELFSSPSLAWNGGAKSLGGY